MTTKGNLQATVTRSCELASADGIGLDGPSQALRGLRHRALRAQLLRLVQRFRLLRCGSSLNAASRLRASVSTSNGN